MLDAVPRESAASGWSRRSRACGPAWTRKPPPPGCSERAAGALGRPVLGVHRGGASDASHIAKAIPLTVDGLGPRGGKAHNPGEFVLAESLLSRAEVALAVAAAAVAG